MWGGGDLWETVENEGAMATAIWARGIGMDSAAVRAWRVSTGCAMGH
jgi:hypothetical protein